MIPEKWRIQRTYENYEMLNKWNNEHPLFREQKREEATYKPGPNHTNGDFFFSDRRHFSPNEANPVLKEYTEITTKQFIDFVLNKIETYEIY